LFGHSELVRLALRGEWEEATERVIPLPDDEPAVFKVYQQWLYSGLIHTREPETESDLREDPRSGLKDCVTDALIEKLDPIERFGPHLTNLIFDNMPSGSPLRRLWMDIQGEDPRSGLQRLRCRCSCRKAGSC
jgi:hypothetical protein